MIMDSVLVDISKLDPKIAYIQVTLYFEKLKLEVRQIKFKQNHNVSYFMFETPFAKEGKARGNPNQWKRRTILTNMIKCQISNNSIYLFGYLTSHFLEKEI
ncbi:hypothetical protein P5V15_002883 [Pogonomyrmex californicus]